MRNHLFSAYTHAEREEYSQNSLGTLTPGRDNGDYYGFLLGINGWIMGLAGILMGVPNPYTNPQNPY